MSELKIKKDQIARLKVLSDYIKKMEGFSPLDENQVFMINENKMSVYGIATNAGAGHIEATFDIESKDTFNFEMSLNSFIKYLEKIKADEIDIKYAKSKMSFSSTTTDTVINQAIISKIDNQDAFTEIKDNLKTKLALDEFKNPIEIDLSLKDLMIELGNFTKVRDMNHEISISKKSIKATDNLCVFKHNAGKDITTEDDILIDRDITILFKGLDSFKISSDKKYFYFNIASYGIQIIFIPKTFNFSYPTDDDIKGIIPANQFIELEVNTEKFYEVIGDFDGIFEASTWRYGQLNVNTPKDFAKNLQLELHYDNMATEMRRTLPVKILQDTEKKDNFEFLIPTLYFKHFKDLLSEESTFKLTYSSIDLDQPNGLALTIKNSKSEIVLTKITL